MRYRSVFSFASATLISRVLGLLREAGIAFLLGAGRFSDVFYVAFRIPNYLRDLLAENAIQTAFVPVFVQSVERRERPERLFSTVFWGILILGALMALLGILLAPVWVTLTAYGFRSIPVKFEFTVQMTRLLFPYLILVGISALLMGVLNAFRIFFLPALAPAFFNLGVLLFIGLAAWQKVTPHVALFFVGIGVLVGGLLQILAQVPAVRKTGIRWARPDPQHPGLRSIQKLFVPVVFNTALTRFTLFVNTLIASFLREGAISYLNYAFRLMHLPIALFGVGVSAVSLPEISRQVDAPEALREELWSAVRGALFLTFPTTVFLMLRAEPIVAVLYRRGAFGGPDVFYTAQALLFYALNIVPFALSRVLLNVFFARKEIRVPNFAFALGAGVNLVIALSLAPVLGFPALALATSLASTAQALLLTGALAREFPMPQTMVGWGGRLIGVTLAAAVPLVAFHLEHPLYDLLVSGGIFVGVFVGLGTIAQIPELQRLWGREKNLSSP